MRRVNQKAAHPSKQKLSLITNKISSLQGMVSKLRGEANLIKKEIVKNKKEKELSSKKLVETNALVEKSGLLLLEKEGEISLLNAEINTIKDLVVKAKAEQLDADMIKEAKLKELAEIGLGMEEKYKLKKENFDKEISFLQSRSDEISKKIKSKNDILADIEGKILGKTDELKKLEGTIVSRAADLNHIETQIGIKLDKYKEYLTKVDQLDGQETSKLLKVQAIENKIKEFESKKAELERDVRLKKEQSISTVMREVQLKKKEDRLRKMYEKVGLAFNL